MTIIPITEALFTNKPEARLFADAAQQWLNSIHEASLAGVISAETYEALMADNVYTLIRAAQKGIVLYPENAPAYRRLIASAVDSFNAHRANRAENGMFLDPIDPAVLAETP